MTSRHHAHGLRLAHLGRRRAQADELMHIAELATCYEVGSVDEFVEVLVEQFQQIGGEGTPEVSEFLCLEVAGLTECSAIAAAAKIADTLDLQYRHPTLWLGVQSLHLEIGRARKAAARCRALPLGTAEEVGREWFIRQSSLGWTAAFNLLDELIIAADPASAALKEVDAADQRRVVVGELEDGNASLWAVLDGIDAQLLNSTVDELANILGAGGDESSKAARRAKALGVLAVPALALRLQQDALQSSLLGAEDQPAPSFLHGPGTGRAAATALAERVGVDGAVGQGGCFGHKCGTITVPPSRLQPKVKVVIHVDAEDVSAHCAGQLQGSAWVEHVGSVSLASLSRLLDGKRVSAQPVIDLNHLEPEDQYRPSVRMAEAVRMLHPYEAFPYSTRRSASADLDHTVAYRASGEGQTRLGNLAPLTRKTHRAKTLGAWRCSQPETGVVEWTSPLGYQYRVGPEGAVALE